MKFSEFLRSFQPKFQIWPDFPASKKYFFAPMFSTTGGMGGEAERFYKQLATKISYKSGQRYCDTIAFIRRRLRFDLLRTCLISLRGFRGTHRAKPAEIDTLDLNLRPQGVY